MKDDNISRVQVEIDELKDIMVKNIGVLYSNLLNTTFRLFCYFTSKFCLSEFLVAWPLKMKYEMSRCIICFQTQYLNEVKNWSYWLIVQWT